MVGAAKESCDEGTVTDGRHASDVSCTDWVVSKDEDASDEDFDSDESSDAVTFHCNPAIQPISRRNVSLAIWQPEKGMAEVVVRKGKLWGTTGVIRDSKLFCHAEEAVCLVERGSLVLMDGQHIMPVAEMYNLLADSKYGCSWGAYQCYAYLRRFGYVVGRHGVSWTTSKKSQRLLLNSACDENPVAQQQPGDKHMETIVRSVGTLSVREEDCQTRQTDVKPPSSTVQGQMGGLLETSVLESSTCCFPRQQEATTMSTGSFSHQVPVSEPRKTRFGHRETSGGAGSMDQSLELQLMFDVHLPNNKFKKSAPGLPSFSLCITSDRPPQRREVRKLEENTQGVPVKFACVQCGHVTICSFDHIQLSCLA